MRLRIDIVVDLGHTGHPGIDIRRPPRGIRIFIGDISYDRVVSGHRIDLFHIPSHHCRFLDFPNQPILEIPVRKRFQTQFLGIQAE